VPRLTECTASYRVVTIKFYVIIFLYIYFWGGVFYRPKYPAIYGPECRTARWNVQQMLRMLIPPTATTGSNNTPMMFIKLSPPRYDCDTSELNDGQVVWQNCHQQLEHSRLVNNTYGVIGK